ncbi:MAG: hypothetical protein AABZ10_06950 [Nitrospirota bacterium]
MSPTLAGLLVFGKYSQAFEPQLVITFLQYNGITEAETTTMSGYLAFRGEGLGDVELFTPLLRPSD